MAKTNDIAARQVHSRPGSFDGLRSSGSSVRPNRSMRVAPNMGSAGTSHRESRTIMQCGAYSPFQEVEFVSQQSSPVPVKSNQQSEAYGGFGDSYGHNHKRKHLAVRVAPQI